MISHFMKLGEVEQKKHKQDFIFKTLPKVNFLVEFKKQHSNHTYYLFLIVSDGIWSMKGTEKN